MSVIKTLSDVEHVLLRPSMYIGSTVTDISSVSMLIEDKVVQDDVVYNHGLERTFLEILYNAADNVERSIRDNIDPGKIYVLVKDDKVVVKNEGNPFPIGREVDGIYDPERALGLLRSGSNFEESRSVSGTNGVGASCTNIFSTVFDVDICNHIEKKRFRVQWRNNMRVISKREISEYDGPSYTKITYICDFSRFYDSDTQHGCAGMRCYSQEMLAAFAKHCLDVSMTTGVPVVFNGKVLHVKDMYDYARYIWDINDDTKYMYFENDSTKCMIVDTESSGRTISFVNGILVQSGTHIDAWQRAICKPIYPALKKIGMSAKGAPKNVFKFLSMILICRYEDIVFSEQVKSKLISPTPSVDALDTKSLVTWKCIKTMAIRYKAIQSSLSSIDKKLDGKKRKYTKIAKLHDAQEAGGPLSHTCTLWVCEGESAGAFVVKCVDGSSNGVLPLQGKPLNVSKVDKHEYEKNTEIQCLKDTLGLSEGTDYSIDSNYTQLRYGKMVICADADVDGSGHIVGLLINYMRKMFPSLLERNPSFLFVLQTPLLKISIGRRNMNFFTTPEYKQWLSDHNNLRHTLEYKKGLGSSTDEEIEEAIECGKMKEYRWDDTAEDLLSMAFDDGHNDDRKEWVLSYDPDKGMSTLAEKYEDDTISRFVMTQLCEYSYVNTQRSIPSLIDSLKEGQRKILAVAMKMTGTTYVTDIIGKVRKSMNYHYGDQSLYRTIVTMANMCVGTNNINLLVPHGQFDSRIGATAAHARYIRSGPSKVVPLIFRPEDSILLRHREEEGKKIEPYYFMPIVPLFAINGTTGIATGFATFIPSHNPIDIIKYIVWWLKQKECNDSTPPELRPYYQGYRGKIYKVGSSWYSAGHYEEIPSRKHIKDIRITEIPVTHTIKSYINKLSSLIKDMPGKVEFKSSPSSIKRICRGVTVKEVIPNITVTGFCPQTDNPLKELGLVEKIPIDSIVLLDHDSKPRVYGSNLYDALSDYCQFRYEKYEERRHTQISIWKKQIDTLILRKKYISDVLDGTISFRHNNTLKPKSKSKMIEDITYLGYPPEFLKMSFLSLTQDSVDAIDIEIDTIRDKLSRYENTTPSSLWKEELKELHTYLTSK